MNNILTNLTVISSLLSQGIPNGKFKEWLRGNYYKYFNSFYSLNEIIDSTLLADDKTLIVKLNNGTTFYGPRVMESVLIKYGSPHKLDKIKNYENFGTFFNQLYERYIEETYEKYYHLEKGNTVIDIGANIGTFSIKAAKAVGEQGKVIAIEPLTNNLKFLWKNIEANHLKNVIVVSKGVWGSFGETKLYFSDLPWGNCANSLYNDNFFGTNSNNGFEFIQVDSLDNILSKLNISKVDFIKTDIEGAEVEALKGMGVTLKCNNLNLAGEHHVLNGKSTYNEIAYHLNRAGFEIRKEGNLFYGRKR